MCNMKGGGKGHEYEQGKMDHGGKKEKGTKLN